MKGSVVMLYILVGFFIVAVLSNFFVPAFIEANKEIPLDSDSWFK